MLNREHLETFATVAAERSFERAAAVMHVTRGAVSQRIRALEERLAVVLLVRDKPVVVTVAGEALLRHVKALQLSEASILAELIPESLSGAPVPIAVAVNADSLATWFPRVLWPLLQKGQVALEVVPDDQDHTLARLARGEVIGCISTERVPGTGFIAEPLGAMEYRCCATGDFAARYFPQGLSLQAALSAPAVLFDRKDSLHNDFLERTFGMRVERYTRHYLPAPVTLLDAVVAGVGYALLPTLQVRDLPRTSALVDLAPDGPVLVKLYWHHWEFEPPLSKEITQRVIEEAARSLVHSARPDSR